MPLYYETFWMYAANSDTLTKLVLLTKLCTVFNYILQSCTVRIFSSFLSLSQVRFNICYAFLCFESTHWEQPSHIRQHCIKYGRRNISIFTIIHNNGNIDCWFNQQHNNWNGVHKSRVIGIHGNYLSWKQWINKIKKFRKGHILTFFCFLLNYYKLPE